MQALILVGGQGTRLRSVVSDVPKPMALVGKRPFLAHLIDYWSSQGVDSFILLTGYLSSIIENYLKQEMSHLKIKCLVESKPQGTGGALLNALPNIDNSSESFLLLNGDTFCEISLGAMLHQHAALRADVTLNVTEVQSNTRYSGLFLKEGKILSFNDAHSQVVNTGVALIRQSALKKFTLPTKRPLGLENELFKKLIDQGSVFNAFCGGKPFIDLGVPQDYVKMQQYFKTKKALI